jgi:1-phosphatidylinositol-4-phosphate 5-kinase
MAKNTNFITKIQFRDNLGLLGLGTMFYLSDRIFDIMDDDRDGKVLLQ